MKKVFLAVFGMLLLLGLVLLMQRDERGPAIDAPAYRTFLSPGDGGFKVTVQWRHTPWSWLTDRLVMGFPGSASDRPAMVYLYDTRSGKILHHAPAEMLQMVDKVFWSSNRVEVMLLVEWELPP